MRNIFQISILAKDEIPKSYYNSAFELTQKEKDSVHLI